MFTSQHVHVSLSLHLNPLLIHPALFSPAACAYIPLHAFKPISHPSCAIFSLQAVRISLSMHLNPLLIHPALFSPRRLFVYASLCIEIHCSHILPHFHFAVCACSPFLAFKSTSQPFSPCSL